MEAEQDSQFYADDMTTVMATDNNLTTLTSMSGSTQSTVPNVDKYF